ncbi:hypothetical protein RM697_05885 [Ichthyenterobacterium sp. W332]|uniref:Uncharacterized protein n=1 Tax=Microcosmobacter mediterraneus TaxID=3075607 RepID=A0ABU2YK18_9FLAO|nr:hypothetical protein [Ichthyenterobacterium sp. W332]MDT0558165.1 hypothetical protein [Ichthyenterobacterium sp. W332]
MINHIKTNILPLFLVVLCLASCRKEEIEIIQPPKDNAIVSGSIVANMLQRLPLNDGSIDNIIDQGNCISIQWPINVTVNGHDITIESINDLDTVEDILDLFDDDLDDVDIVYPITVITTEFNTLQVENQSQLNAIRSNCNGENIFDEDIECIDFDYPITTSVFNTISEALDTYTFFNDQEFHTFISTITTEDIISLELPVNVFLYDNSTIQVTTVDELETTIENNLDTCDEDDDYNYNDDDCNDCTVTQLETLLANCSLWTVDNLERNVNDEDYYVGYEFSFSSDGTMVADYAIWSYPGTWQASGSGNNIIVTIDVPSLPDCNNDWILHEITTDNDQTKFDLNLGDDKIRYVATCDSFDDTILTSTLLTGSWEVSYYFDDSDLTSDFNVFTLNFLSNGSLEVEDSVITYYGWWSTLPGEEEDLELNINFGDPIAPLFRLIEDWEVVSISATTIMLREIDLGDGTEDFLTLEKL